METTRREMVMAAGAMAATAMTPTAFAAAWTPNERYPDPAIQVLDPSFNKYRINQTTGERRAIAFTRCT